MANPVEYLSNPINSLDRLQSAREFARQSEEVLRQGDLAHALTLYAQAWMQPGAAYPLKDTHEARAAGVTKDELHRLHILFVDRLEFR